MVTAAKYMAAPRTCAAHKHDTHIVALDCFADQGQYGPVMNVLVGGTRAIAIGGFKLILPASLAWHKQKHPGSGTLLSYDMLFV